MVSQSMVEFLGVCHLLRKRERERESSEVFDKKYVTTSVQVYLKHMHASDAHFVILGVDSSVP